uniref:Uncharacterized protein n=1 Tax=Physcomitrium patens TaxID=3218 RepID=A0A7I4BCW6_PHYPA
MASLGGQLCSGIHSLSCQGRANTKLHPIVVKSRKCEVARASYDAQVQTSRREAITRLAIASGAALLSLVAATDAAHAAAGEIETAEEAASNPLIQKLLETSRANKAVNDAARLEDYYRRNFTEYFQFVELCILPL